MHTEYVYTHKRNERKKGKKEAKNYDYELFEESTGWDDDCSAFDWSNFKYVLFVDTSGRFTYNSNFFKCRCGNSDGNSAGMSWNNVKI